MLKIVPIGSIAPAFPFPGWRWQTVTIQFSGLLFWDGYHGSALMKLILSKLELQSISQTGRRFFL
jgi:hypothetical protein